MTQFDKPALSIADHIQKLKDRSLIITHEASASFCLSNISYFRLSAYTGPFYVPNREDHLFKSGTKFEDILSLYTFDRELRLLLLDRYPSVSRPHMGFPENWDLDPFWENAMTNSDRMSRKK
jgi:abortive infection bacteriophage resistance protein